MNWQLVPLGRQPWATLRQQIPAGAQCAWADIDGFHIGDAPSELAGVTHLWVAADKAGWRLRVDGSTVIGAKLELAEGAGDPSIHVEHVEVSARLTPDPGLRGRLDQAIGMRPLTVSSAAGDVWFLSKRH